MGKTSTDSKWNLPGRFAWTAAEAVGPLNLAFILYTLPAKLRPQPTATTSFMGTGLQAQQEVLGLLYLLHYLNRAVITPQLLAPSMSPIHLVVALLMVFFQFINSTSIGCWIIYGGRNITWETRPFFSMSSLVGLLIFFLGMAGNIIAENQLFTLRRGAAKRKARSEGKAVVTYDKVYVIPPAEGLYRYVLYPHFVLEWLEWTGYWILGGAWGFGWGNKSAALWFVIFELASMMPRTVTGKHWYEKKFGKRAVAGRAGSVPLIGL